MATDSAVHRWTVEEFYKLPDDDGKRREIIAGELYVTPTQGPPHQLVLMSFLGPMYRFVEREHDLGWLCMGPLDVLFAEGDFLEPDIVIERNERRSIIGERGVEAAPDLIVEIVSDDTAERDRGIKRERYARYAVPEYWVVDPERRTVEVYRPAEDPDRPSRIERGRFAWEPVPGGPVLKLDLGELLEDYDDLMRMIRTRENQKSAT